MVYEIVIIVLLAVICFLLYKLYRIKYIEGGESKILPERWRKELMNLDSDGGKGIEMKFEGINSRISELEDNVKNNENVIKKLVEELS